jgi:hypothetical protein
MAVYRRNDTWWYEFQFQGRRIRESSGFKNKTAALRAEAKRRADLIDRRAGFAQAKLAPKFEDYVVQFFSGRNNSIDRRPTVFTSGIAKL